MSLYERLRKEHYFYCQGKKPGVLKVVCEYIEARIQRKPLTANQIYLKYNVGRSLLFKRCREIVKLLKLENEADWKWKRK